MSLDTEYTADPWLPDPPRGLTEEPLATWDRHAQTNRILSYQLIVIDTHTGLQAWTLLEPKARLKLGDILRTALDLIGVHARKARPRKPRTRQKAHQDTTPPPLRICLVWHWGSAETGALSDRAKLVPLHHSTERPVVCIGGGVVSLKSFTYCVELPGKNYAKVLVALRDTYRLADEHTSLDVLGEAIGIPKVDIHPWTKDRMDLLQHEHHDLFTRYAMTDAEISLEWFFRVAETNETVLRLRSIPPTTGAASASGLKNHLKKSKSFQKHFAVYYKKGVGWQPRKERAVHESFPQECFLGGCNQSYRLGHIHGTVLDLDLSGAYGAAMGTLPAINWSKLPVAPQDPRELIDPISFALVRFQFPAGTQHPCLPVGTDHGLVYPLACLSDPAAVTGPEIHEALRMGCEVEIVRSIRFLTEGLLLADYIGYLADERRRYPDKRDPRNAAAKLAINSLYGKFGQGLANRYTNAEIFSEQEIESMTKMPQCTITFPHAAAAITGLVRAVLNALVLEAAKLGWMVLSSTTDGFMVLVPNMTLTTPICKGTPHLDVPRALVEACEQHPSVELLMAGRSNIGEDPHAWLEVKYAGNEAYTVKTRMNWIGWNGETVNQAMVGFHKDHVDFHELMRGREDRLRRFHTEHRLNKIVDVNAGDAEDITSYYQSRAVNLSPDWKRKFRGDDSSTPFADMEEFARYRRAVDALGSQAWPDLVVFTLDETKPSMTDQAIRREVLHRIALALPGFRLPQGLSRRAACRLLGLPENAIAKLAMQRKGFRELPAHREVERIKHTLALW